jgi:hypothetical protein
LVGDCSVSCCALSHGRHAPTLDDAC